MNDRYVVHVHRHAHDDLQYITGHIEIKGTGYQRFFSGYAGLRRALSETGHANEPAVAGQGSHPST